MADPMTLDDEFMPLAFSLHANRNRYPYAVLAGAGVSIEAGVPSAWGVVVELVNAVKELRFPDEADLTDQTAEGWFLSKFGYKPTYSTLLEELGKTQPEREGLLRDFFERPDPDTGSPPGPTEAHRAVARLMEMKVVGVVVTLNFDHLFEHAIRDRGMTPYVISTDAAAHGGSRSLRTRYPCVIHLHGEYRDAASMLNTVAELKKYPKHMRKLLIEVVANYGLIVAGWSATHDVGLRRAVEAHYHPNHYTMGWIDRSDLNPTADQLSTNMRAKVWLTPASNALGRLADQVDALGKRQARPPHLTTVAAGRIKQQLTQDKPAVHAHDMVAAEFANLYSANAFHLRSHDTGDGQTYADLAAQLVEAARVPAACVATLTYWGDESTDEWWMPEVERCGRRRDRLGGDTNLIHLPYLAGAQLLYAAGVAASARGRYTLLARLLRMNDGAPGSPPAQLLSEVLEWSKVHGPANAHAVAPAADYLPQLLNECLTLNSARIDAAREDFEILRAVTQVINSSGFGAAVASSMQTESANRALEQLPGAMPPSTSQIATQLANKCKIHKPHVRLIDSMGTPKWICPRADRLLEENISAMTVFVSDLPDTQKEPALKLAFEAAKERFRQIQGALPFSPYVPTPPSSLWLDTGEIATSD